MPGLRTDYRREKCATSERGLLDKGLQNLSRVVSLVGGQITSRQWSLTGNSANGSQSIPRNRQDQGLLEQLKLA